MAISLKWLIRNCRVMISVIVFNATFNNIPVISWRLVLLMEETGGPGDKLYHIMLYWIHLDWAGFELATLVVIGTNCTSRYKSNYHTITTTSTPTIIVRSSISVIIYAGKSFCVFLERKRTMVEDIEFQIRVYSIQIPVLI